MLVLVWEVCTPCKGANIPAQCRTRIMHPWVQKRCLAVRLGSGRRFLGRFPDSRAGHNYSESEHTKMSWQGQCPHLDKHLYIDAQGEGQDEPTDGSINLAVSRCSPDFVDSLAVTLSCVPALPLSLSLSLSLSCPGSLALGPGCLSSSRPLSPGSSPCDWHVDTCWCVWLPICALVLLILTLTAFWKVALQLVRDRESFAEHVLLCKCPRESEKDAHMHEV